MLSKPIEYACGTVVIDERIITDSAKARIFSLHRIFLGLISVHPFYELIPTVPPRVTAAGEVLAGLNTLTQSSDGCTGSVVEPK